jgi:hypothetical protein
LLTKRLFHGSWKRYVMQQAARGYSPSQDIHLYFYTSMAEDAAAKVPNFANTHPSSKGTWIDRR